MRGPDGVAIFGPGMTRPKMISGSMPVMSAEARRRYAQGTVIVRCVITVEGALTDCQVLRSVPLLDQSILDALATQRFTPVTFEGRALAVSYIFPFKILLE